MHSMVYCVLWACSLMTIIVGLPLKTTLNEEFALCGPELVIFIKIVCKDHIPKIKNDIAERRELLLSECCLNKCSAKKIITNFCPDERVIYESENSSPLGRSSNDFIQNPLKITSPSISTYKRIITTEVWNQNMWAAINRALSKIFENGPYQWGFSGSQLTV